MALDTWVQKTQPVNDRWRRQQEQHKGSAKWTNDCFVGGRAAKMMFLCAGCEDEVKCVQRYEELRRCLPVVAAEVEVCVRLLVQRSRLATRPIGGGGSQGTQRVEARGGSGAGVDCRLWLSLLWLWLWLRLRRTLRMECPPKCWEAAAAWGVQTSTSFAADEG